MKSRKIRTIKVCAGIGDNIWLLQKLVNTGEKFNFQLASDLPRRGKQIFDLLPSIVKKSDYTDHFTSLVPLNNDAQEGGRLWSELPRGDIFLAANHHLEAGNRIEEYLPDLKTSFKLPFETKKFVKSVRMLMPQGDTRYIGIYTSSYLSSRQWGFWEERKWFDLIKRMHKKGNGKYKFILLGANFDIDLNTDLLVMLEDAKIPHIPIIGKKLGYVIEIMKRLNYFVAFPSGLPIISTMLRKPTLMFYPTHLKKLMYAWADPKMIKNNTYTAKQFCEVDSVLKWMKDDYKLFDQLS